MCVTEAPIIIVSRTFTCKIKGNNKTAEQSRGERFNNIQGQLDVRKPKKPTEGIASVQIIT